MIVYKMLTNPTVVQQAIVCLGRYKHKQSQHIWSLHVSSTYNN